MRDFLSIMVSSALTMLSFSTATAYASEHPLETFMQQNEELAPLSEAAQSLPVGGVYRHYKGTLYKVLAIARHSESLEEMVVYQDLSGEHAVWARPVEMFLESVVIQGQLQLRFTPISE